MRILHLSSEYPPQQVFGLGRFVYDLAGAQAAAGHEVCVITNSMGGERNDLVERGVRVCRVAFPPPPKPVEEATTVMQFNVQLVERAVAVCDQWRPEVVNVHDWLTAAAGKVLRRVCNIPLVVTIHDTVIGKHFGALENEQRFIARTERWICHQADRVICCSTAVRAELIEHMDVDPAQIDVIPCGVDPAAFATERSPLALQAFRSVLAAPDQPILLYVGRLDAEKGVETLLEGFKAVARQRPDARLVIAGKGVLQPRLMEWTTANQLAKQVFWAGYVKPPALAYLYRAADIQIVPSAYEPFGIVALEGMAAGLPVIASATGGLRDIVEEGATGHLFEPRNCRQLAEAILGLLADAPKRERFGTAGRARAQQHFSWSHISRETNTSYATAPARRQPFDSAHPRPGHPSTRIEVAPARPTILFDCSPIHPGMTGIGIYADAVLERLPATWPEARILLLVTPGNKLHMVNTHGHALVVGGPDSEFRFPQRQQALARAALDARADVFFSPIYTALMGSPTPSVSMIHDLSFLAAGGSLPPALLDYTVASSRHLADQAQTIVTVSDVVRRAIVREYGVPDTRVVVAPPGVDDCLSRPTRPASLIARTLKRLGVSGSYLLAVNLTHPRKNTARLMAGFAQARGSHPEPLSLVIVGNVGPGEPNVWRCAYDAGVHRHVVMTGHIERSDLLTLYAGAAALCMPSLDEGFGMPVAEAMGWGTPVVVSDLPVFHEVAGTAGIFVDPTDAGSIADGIRRAVGDGRDADAIRHRRMQADRFRWEATATTVAQALRAALKGS